MGIEVLIMVGGMIASAGAAWGGTRVALNGTKSRVAELVSSHQTLNEKMDAHIAHDATVQVDLVDRASRTEGKVDLILERLPR